ncbi:colicin immunity protein Cui [Dryocola clanedunensis]|uniref:colicin immunity protein Cui n=1 Tax=Dryocola clanedunensis TaxID=2925396 RepID=UPI0038CC1DD5
MLIITSIPILIFFAVYQNNPESQFLEYIYNTSIGLPVLHSSNNPLLSSVMSAYCKTAPFWGLVFFIISINKLPLKNGVSVSIALKGTLLFTLLYLPLMYMFLLHSTEMTQARKLARLMSQNDYFLTISFLIIYAGCYLFTAYYLVMLAAVCKALNNKEK